MFDFFNKEVAIIPNQLINQYKKMEISSEAFILLMYLVINRIEIQSESYLQRVSQAMGWPEVDFYDYLAELLGKGYIRFEMVKGDNGKQHDAITVEPLFDLLYPKPEPINQELNRQIKQLEQSANLIEIFEGEFGRSLTQMELMQITAWKKEDQVSDELITLALQQAVLNQALSLKYIDRILLDWKKKNIRTVEEAKREMEAFNANKSQNERQKQTQIEYEPFKFPEIDWDNF